MESDHAEDINWTFQIRAYKKPLYIKILLAEEVNSSGKKHIVYLALGSNIGDRLAYLREAVIYLEKNGINILKHSSIIETDPVGGPPQGKFLNAALKAETTLSPADLLAHLKSIERNLGREQTEKNGPRPIDIDILLYDNISIKNPTLTIPHPRMFEREFVMQPLLEIEPRIIKKITGEHAQKKRDKQRIKIVGPL